MVLFLKIVKSAFPPDIWKTSADSNVASVELFNNGASLGTATLANGEWSVSISNPADGDYIITATATDKAGNTATSTTPVKFTVDTTGPDGSTISIRDPADGFTTNAQAIDIAGTSSGDAVSVNVFLDGSTTPLNSNPIAVTGGSWSIIGASISSLADGQYTLIAKGIDSLGNQGTTGSAKVTFNIDRTVPAVTINSATDGNNNAVSNNGITKSNSIAFSFTASDNTGGSGTKSIECSLDNAAFVACSSPVSYSGLADSSHTLTVRVTDNAGNTATATWTWTVDTIPPIGTTINSATDGNNNAIPRGGTTNSPSIAFSFTASDNNGIKSIQCKLDTAAPADCTSPKTYSNIADGSHSFTVKVTDNAGNTATASWTWTVDATAPAAPIITSPTQNSFTAANPITVSVNNIETGTTVSILEGSTVLASTTASGTSVNVDVNLGEGQHTITAKSTDAAGNSASSSAVTFTVDRTAPRVTASQLGGTYYNVPLSVSLVDTTNDPTTTIYYTIDGSNPSTTKYKIYRSYCHKHYYNTQILWS